MFNRYAIYFTPPPGDLAQRGAAWLGWDVQTGQAVPHPAFPGVDIAKATKTPRKYGFHGTMKAPFFLAEAQTEQSLAEALERFCGGQQAFSLEGLKLSQIGPFLALTPVGDTTQLNTLASDVVRVLDHFRAPIEAEEFNRKNKPSLSDAQRHYLEEFGYPHVMEFFRFHMTLTGGLTADEADNLRPVLERQFGDVIPSPFPITALTLCGERPDGYFHQINRFALGKASNSL